LAKKTKNKNKNKSDFYSFNARFCVSHSASICVYHAFFKTSCNDLMPCQAVVIIQRLIASANDNELEVARKWFEVGSNQ